MAAAASASPAADPALLYTAGGAVVPAAGYPVVSPLTYAAAPLAHTIPVAHTTYTVPEVSVPTVGLKDTGLVVHPESGAITPEFTAAQVRTTKPPSVVIFIAVNDSISLAKSFLKSFRWIFKYWQ